MKNSINEPSVGAVLRDLPVGKFVTVKKIDQGGALQGRRLAAGGIQFYWRFTHEAKTDRVAIGVYDPSAPPKSLEPTAKGYSIAAAMEVCRIKGQIQQQTKTDGGYREYAARAALARAEAREKKRQAEEQTLSKLLDTYTDFLKANGQASHADTKNTFRLHVKEALPAIAACSAVAVTKPQIESILRKLRDANKGRTANKLRSNLSAAYQCAVNADSLPSFQDEFAAFGIVTNVVALTKRIAKHDRSDKNPLSLSELRKYWRLIENEPGVRGAALRLHLLTGGQRIQQLARLRNINVEDHRITLFDGKGASGADPRENIVPLIPKAVDAINVLKNQGEYVLSTDLGVRQVNQMTLTKWAQNIAADIPGFQLKRIRSAVETHLCAAKISDEIRGRLLSHGISGVQSKHYNAHEYEDEKRAALETWFDLLEVEEV